VANTRHASEQATDQPYALKPYVCEKSIVETQAASALCRDALSTGVRLAVDGLLDRNRHPREVSCERSAQRYRDAGSPDPHCFGDFAFMEITEAVFCCGHMFVGRKKNRPRE